jgi:Holliday junction resolvasome RuvABC endonuclease subunit
MSKSLGIDVGAKRMGFAIVDKVDGEYSLGDYGVMGLDKEEGETYADYHQNLVKYWPLFGKRLDIWRPDIITSELMPVIPTANSMNVSQRVSAKISVCLCMHFAFEQFYEWNEISAVSVKKRVAGDAKATKAALRRAIIRDVFPQLKGVKMLDDESDAIAIALCGLDYGK